MPGKSFSKRRRRGERVIATDEAPPLDHPVACAFCGDEVAHSDVDPIGLGVVEMWRPHDEALDWMVYAHRRCFIDRLHADTRAIVDL